MFQDFKNSIYHPIHTIFGGIKYKGGFNPKLLEFRDFVLVKVTEHAQFVWKFQRQFRKEHQPQRAEFALCTGLGHANSYSIECMGKSGFECSRNRK